jgi:hypothetical protein
MDPEQKRTLCKSLEAEMIGASAFMEAEELLDSEGPAFFRGFIEGYNHCLKLAEEFDAISNEEKLL